MTPRARVLATIAGSKTDRVPFCLWYHLDPKPAAGPDSKMGQMTLDFYNRYRPDIMKVMHDIDFEPIPRIKAIEDWARLDLLDPHTGNLGRQLHTLGEVRAALDSDVPMIATVFGVYHYADLISEGRILAHLRQDPEAVHAGLAILAVNLATYSATVISEVGAEGIYYALQGASEGFATRDEYSEHFLGYDRLVMRAAAKAPINVVHLHGYNGLYFDLVHDLPAAVICWSDVAGGPSMAEARKIHAGCLMGGVDETQFVNMTRKQIIAQGRAAIEDAGGERFILGPGCSIPTDSDPDSIDAFRAAVEG